MSYSEKSVHRAVVVTLVFQVLTYVIVYYAYIR